MLQAHIKDDFKDLTEFREWVKKGSENISYQNRVMLDRFNQENIEKDLKVPGWFGGDVTYNQLAKGISEYRKPELINEMLDKVNDSISNRLKNRLKAKKVRFNPNGLGVFIFDRAAMGMYRLKELYSEAHNKIVEREEVYKTKKGLALIQDNTAVKERWEEKPDGSPKIRTTNKNVYAYLPPVSKDKNAVEIYICCGAHALVTADNMLYSGISAIVVAQLLEKARIKTKINIVLGTSPDKFKTVYGAIIPVKNYDETLDMNLLALLSSDPRFYRYEGMKSIVPIYDHFKGKIPMGIGLGLTADMLKKTIEDSSYTGNAALAPNRLYMGRTFSEAEAMQMIEKAIEDIADNLQQ